MQNGLEIAKIRHHHGFTLPEFVVVPPETRVLRYCWLKLVQRCLLYLRSKKHYVLKRKSYWQNVARLYFTQFNSVQFSSFRVA